ncbi:amidohydrolase family protein [Edaphobacter bradus]|uniref:amidohydrolase family protein n=1 Tax=Edaphobacter bradus TaxID=2259016 RepID=UPI0021DFFA61|nr:amidohydrolase family protein [Edaphobacter bradus]
MPLLLASWQVQAQDMAIVGAKVYTSPEAQPTSNTTIIIRNGRIAAVGEHAPIPAAITKISCATCIVFAGFWNTHVHFTEQKWVDASSQPAEKLTQQLQQMLTLSGFTTVVDTASIPDNTIALRHRIEAGEVLGPHIYTAGAGLFPPHALPYYVKDMPPAVLAHLPQPNTPAEAVTEVQKNIAAGTDIVKLFAGSIVSNTHIVPMPLPIAEAAVAAGHEHGQLVFAHPSNLEGTRVAMQSGVDLLAHAPEAVDGIDDVFIGQIVAHHMAMIPTLKLFSGDSDIARIRTIVARFHQLGGKLMFSTDTGFLTDYDVKEEYRQLALAGLNYRDVLAMLTTAPAERFHVSDQKGRIVVGMAGDVTVLSADPASDPLAFTRVLYAIRGGRIIASAP